MRLLLLASIVAIVGCVRPPSGPPVTVPQATLERGDRGEVAYRFLLDPNAFAATLEDGEVFVEPRAEGALPLPVYPPAALAAGAGAARVVVRIVIDTSGRIANVIDSPLASSSSGPFADEFRNAVLRALRRWRFSPGAVNRVEEGADDDGDGRADYRRVARSDPVAVFYDVRFDFDLVGGEGRVRTSAPSP